MAIPGISSNSSCYSTAFYSYSEITNGSTASIAAITNKSNSNSNASNASNANDAAQSSLNGLVQGILRRNSQNASPGLFAGIEQAGPTRWALRIRTYRLVLPQTTTAGQQQQQQPTRTMYTVHDSTDTAHDAPLTVIIEDSRASAVNISTIPAHQFEYFLSVALLPPSGTGSTGGGQGSIGSAGDGKEMTTQQQAQRARIGRWVPRPIYILVEGVCIADSASDFQISAATLSTRGGEAGASASQSTKKLVLQLDYTPTAFFREIRTRTAVLDQYLDAVLPRSSTRKDLSLDITSLDWRSLLGVPFEGDEHLPKWGRRNTAWCLVKMLKAEGLV